MDPSCLQYALTEDERRTFDDDGYLILENALEPEHVAALTAVTDRLHAQRLADGHDPHKALFVADFIPRDDAYLDLIDYERTFPKVWGILGWNISLYHSHLIVTPPSGRQPDGATLGWHQDSARVNADIETDPRPRLSMKVAFFLSDVSEPGRGNFWIVPGSHLNNDLTRPAGGSGQPEGAIPVCVRPGTAVFFDRRLWHAASPNWSDVTRKVLFYGYGYRWLKPKDDMSVQGLWERSDPIRRQLLGAGTSSNGYYRPGDDDVPLRAWLAEHSPADAGDIARSRLAAAGA